MEWKETKKKLPDTDRRVLIWWDKAEEDERFRPVPGVAFGRYLDVIKEFRPTGCMYDCTNQISHWAEIPPGPDVK